MWVLRYPIEVDKFIFLKISKVFSNSNPLFSPDVALSV
jgi:hypothetical protein